MAKDEYNAKDRQRQSTPEEVANRVARNRLRREAIREGRVRKGDGRDIDHITPMSRGGARNGPTRVTSATDNRRRGGALRSNPGSRKK